MSVPLPPPPTPPPPASTPKPPATLNEAGGESIKDVKLKKNTKTVVKQAVGNSLVIQNRIPLPTKQYPYRGPPQVVLIITKHWIVYEWLESHIKKILFTSEESLKALNKENPHAKKEYVSIHSFNDLTSGLLEWKAEQLHKIYNFTHVIVLAEEDLIRGARIRKSLGILHGQTVDSAMRYRDKVLMKSILKENNIGVPEFAPVESATDVIEFVKKHGNQVVVKPRKGYSSVNTWIIRTEEDLQKFLDSGFNRIGGFDSALDLEVETFVNGSMYHIDGLVYDGEVKLAWPSKYLNICAEFQNSKYLASYTLSPSNPLVKRLQAVCVQTLTALGGPSCYPFHGEYWVTPDDQIIFCEMASRTGGAWVRHVIWRLFEIMQDKTFSQWQVQQEISHPELGDNYEERQPITSELAGWMFIYPEVGEILSIPKSCPLPFVAFSETFAVPGEVFSSRLNCVDSVFSAIFTGKDEQEMIHNAKALYDWFESETKYGPLNK